MTRVFFVGAGASVADGFPVTSDLMAALAHAVHHRGRRPRSSHRLYDYLTTVYAVSGRHLDAAAAAWQAFVTGRRQIGPQCLPSIVEVLSVLDTVLEEGMSLGRAADAGRRTGSAPRNLDSDELRGVRDSVQRALVKAFMALHKQRSPATFEKFVETLSAEDVVITTNWDLLLDRALDARFGPPRDGASFGTPQASLRPDPRTERVQPRPLLLKLHGSLNWLWCMQCGALTIDRSRTPGGKENENSPHDYPYGFKCPCGGEFTALMVTPTFLKRYQNHHLGAVWREALSALIYTPHWTFIGYSLPPDDVAIRAMLLKAVLAHRRATAGNEHVATDTRVHLVMKSRRGRRDADTLARYQQICGPDLAIDAFWNGFAEWLTRRGTAVAGRRMK